MNKTILAVIAFVMLVGGGFFVLTSGDDEAETNEVAVQSNQAAQPVGPTDSEAPASAEEVSAVSGAYVDFSDDSLASAEGTDRIVFFHAEWCSTCNFFKDDITTSGVPAGVTILEADFDSDEELKERYGVTVQSTFVLLDENGEVVRSWPFASGLRSAEDLFNAVAEA